MGNVIKLNIFIKDEILIVLIKGIIVVVLKRMKLNVLVVLFFCVGDIFCKVNKFIGGNCFNKCLNIANFVR